MPSEKSMGNSDERTDAGVSTTLSLVAEQERLGEVMAWIEGQDIIDMSIQMPLQLVTEELFRNIAIHGYPNTPGPVRLYLTLIAQGIVLTIEDEGLPFDPLSQSALPDVDAEIEDRAIGGLGVHLVRNMTVKQEYQRVNGCNRITLTFAASDGGGPPHATEDVHRPKADGETPEQQPRSRLILPLLLRVVLPIGVVLAASLMLAALLNVLKLEYAFQDAAKIRYDSALRELRDTIERSFGTGLSLQSNNAIKIALERTAGLYDDEITLYVSDSSGRMVHWSSKGNQELTLSEIERGIGLPEDKLAHVLKDALFRTSTPLIVEYKQIGTLTLTFPAEQLSSHRYNLRSDFAL
jgi:anti-sigma regulatory factor (Ser/Thr protein kinase)